MYLAFIEELNLVYSYHETIYYVDGDGMNPISLRHCIAASISESSMLTTLN